jgi:hypothetical protein
MIGNTREYLAQIRFGVAVVELSGADQAVDRSRSLSAGIAAREEIVLTSQRDASQCPFGCVVVDLNTPVVAKSPKSFPARERIAYGFCRLGFLRNPLKGLREPIFHGIEQRSTSFASHRTPLIRRSSADIALDGIERPDALQRLRRNRGFLRLMYVEEVPSYMRPTGSSFDYGATSVGAQA